MKMKPIIILIITILLLVGCSNDHKSNTGPEITSDHVVIQGVVTDTTGDSIHYLSGVAVKLMYGTTTLKQTTSDSGNFSFSIDRVTVNTLDSFRFVIGKTYYQPLDTLIKRNTIPTNDSKDTLSLNFNLTKLAMLIQISGQIFSYDNYLYTSIPDASIKLIQNGIIIDNQLSDHDGRFLFVLRKTLDSINIPFTLTIQKENILSIDTSFQVTQSLEDKYVYNKSLRIVTPYISPGNYFRLHVGNKWEYEAYSYFGDSWGTRISGNETWEIISIDATKNTFVMRVTFTGTKQRFASGSLESSIDYNNSTTDFTLDCLAGKLRIIDYNNSDSCLSIFVYAFAGARNRLFDIINFIHEIVHLEEISFTCKTGVGTLGYSLYFGKGLTKLDYSSLINKSWTVYKYNLISFSMGDH